MVCALSGFQRALSHIRALFTNSEANERRRQTEESLQTQRDLLHRRQREHEALIDVRRMLRTGSPLLHDANFFRDSAEHRDALRMLLAEHVRHREWPRPAAPGDEFVYGAWLSGDTRFTQDEALAAAGRLHHLAQTNLNTDLDFLGSARG